MRDLIGAAVRARVWTCRRRFLFWRWSGGGVLLRAQTWMPRSNLLYEDGQTVRGATGRRQYRRGYLQALAGRIRNVR